MSENAETAARRPRTFWCNECQKWTPVEEEYDAKANLSGFYCKVCGESYLCDECGYDIDRSGQCQRPEGHHNDG